MCRNLHIDLSAFATYELAAWTLLLGSSRELLSRANNCGFTPLHFAVMYGASVEMVRALALLADWSSKRDHRNGNGVLHYAAQLHNAARVDALLEPPSRDEHRALTGVLERRHEDVAVERADRVRGLSYAQVVATALNARNTAGETPLHLAVRASDLEITRRLLDAGADPCLEVLCLIIYLSNYPYRSAAQCNSKRSIDSIRFAKCNRSIRFDDYFIHTVPYIRSLSDYHCFAITSYSVL